MAPITPEWKDGIKQFQREQGFPPDEIDGIVGPDTLSQFELVYQQKLRDCQNQKRYYEKQVVVLEEKLEEAQKDAKQATKFGTGALIGAIGGFLGAMGIFA